MPSTRRCSPARASTASRFTIGAAVFPAGGRIADELLGNSHLAFCRAKATKRGGHVLFEEQIRRELETRLTLEAELAVAAERKEFELFYQPQVHLGDGSLIGAEALIRWRHPVRGLVSPAEFMPVVNTSPISERIADWVLETACTQAAAWERAGQSCASASIFRLRNFGRATSQPRSRRLLATHRPHARPASNWRSPKTSCCTTSRACWTRS